MHFTDYYTLVVMSLRDLGMSEQIINTHPLVDELIHDGFFGHDDITETAELIHERLKDYEQS